MNKACTALFNLMLLLALKICIKMHLTGFIFFVQKTLYNKVSLVNVNILSSIN